MSANSSSFCVSVLICTYDGERYISNTLDSVIDQKYENLEILIHDDDSKDATVSILNRYSEMDNRITVFESKKNIRPYNGYNRLLEEAEGEYIAIQDHDDIWHPEKIRCQIDFLENNNSFVACGGCPVKYWEKDDAIYKIDVDEISNFAPHPSLLFRNNGYRYDTSINYKTDMYFMEFILCQGNKQIYNFQKALYISMVRDDGKNLSSNWTNMKDVIHYGIRSRNLEYIPLSILWELFPQTFPDNQTDELYEQAELQSVSTLEDDPHTAPFLDYLSDYIGN